MLVLSRKNGESIRLGNDIEITVCQVNGNRVRLAISAPKNVPIRRSELPELSRPADKVELPLANLSTPQLALLALAR